MRKILVLASIIILLSSIVGIGAVSLTNFDAAIPNEVNNKYVSPDISSMGIDGVLNSPVFEPSTLIFLGVVLIGLSGLGRRFLK